jgi:hypothetical protein
MDPITRPGVTLLDSQGAPISWNNKDAGGEVLPDDRFVVTTDVEGIVTLSKTRVAKDDAGNDVTVTAPPGTVFAVDTHPGTVNVTVTDSIGGRVEILPITIAFSAPGELGLSVGEAFTDPGAAAPGA